MGGVAANEDAAIPKFVSHKAATGPIFLADDLVGKVSADALRKAQSRSTESNSCSFSFR